MMDGLQKPPNRAKPKTTFYSCVEAEYSQARPRTDNGMLPPRNLVVLVQRTTVTLQLNATPTILRPRIHRGGMRASHRRNHAARPLHGRISKRLKRQRLTDGATGRPRHQRHGRFRLMAPQFPDSRLAAAQMTAGRCILPFLPGRIPLRGHHQPTEARPCLRQHRTVTHGLARKSGK